MTWTATLRFKFPEKATFRAALPDYMKGGNGDLLTGGDTYALYEVGTLYRDDTGEAREGWHVDLRLQDEAEVPVLWVPYLVQVNNPKHEFA
jgi:GTPase SAR1 family protein